MWVFSVRCLFELAGLHYFLIFRSDASHKKVYKHFDVGQFMKAKTKLQEELAREKASLFTEVKCLERRVERMRSKVLKLTSFAA